MFSFDEYINLNEAKASETGETKVAVFAFGRFNPPTKGHMRMIQTTLKLAHEKGGDAFIFPSQSVDTPSKRTGFVNPKTSKNPLPWKVKIAFMHAVFPEASHAIKTAPEIKSPFQVPLWLGQQGYTDVYFVAGSDRVDEYNKRIGDTARQYFDHVEVVSAGTRDPDAEGVTGMSASKARKAAIDNDLMRFRAATGWDGDTALKMMDEVRKGAGMGAEANGE